MESLNNQFPLGLTFDDVLLLPGISTFSRGKIDISTKFTKKILIQIPFVASPMDTVTESRLAIALGELGGIGIIHRNLPVEIQADEVEKVKKNGFLVGAAIGAAEGYKQRLEALVKAGVDAVVVDSAHGCSPQVVDAIIFSKNKYKKLQVIGGSVATYEGAKFLIKAGVDALRVGMGPGAICTTRIVSGMGVPQITAIQETVRAARKYDVPVIADGGIRYSGDIVKALAAGASTVMMGSFFAATREAPGRVVKLTRANVPHRFLSIFGKNRQLIAASEKAQKKNGEIVIADGVEKLEQEELYEFKEYRGMGSEGAMEKGAKIKSEGEFHGKDYKDRVLVAEGVEGFVPIRGSVKDVTEQALGGIKSGLYYVGTKNIPELWENSRFIQITRASLQESHPHDILITNPGSNY